MDNNRQGMKVLAPSSRSFLKAEPEAWANRNKIANGVISNPALMLVYSFG